MNSSENRDSDPKPMSSLTLDSSDKPIKSFCISVASENGAPYTKKIKSHMQESISCD